MRQITLEFRGDRIGNEKQVDELNQRVKLKVQPSPIHGVGVFALRDISKGEKLYANCLPAFYDLPYSHFTKLFPHVRELLLERFPRIVEGELFAYPDSLLQSFMNHSDEYNYCNKTDTALIDIPKGTELCENYRDIPGWETAFPWLMVK